MRETWIQSLGREDPRRREWLPTPVCWPGESHGQRNLAGYSPWCRRVEHDWATNTFNILIGTSKVIAAIITHLYYRLEDSVGQSLNKFFLILFKFLFNKCVYVYKINFFTVITWKLWNEMWRPQKFLSVGKETISERQDLR